MSNKVRQSNFELLRIVSILMIVFHHVLVHGMSESYSKEVIHFIDSFLIYGVNLFILISGYFLIQLKWKSIFNLFWICSFCKIFHLTFESIYSEQAPIEWILKPIAIPFSSGGWFVDVYILLLLFSPFINIALNRMKNNELFLFLISFTIFDIVYCWLLGRESNTSGYTLHHFIYIYILGYSIKRFNIYNNTKSLYLILGYIVFSVLTFILSQYSGKSFSYNSLFVILGSVSIFLYFSKLNVKSKLINQVSMSVLSIYLMTDGGLFSKKLYGLYSQILTPPFSIVSISLLIILVLSVCVAAVMLDRIRIIMFNHIIYPIIRKVLNRKKYAYLIHRNS